MRQGFVLNQLLQRPVGFYPTSVLFDGVNERYLNNTFFGSQFMEWQPSHGGSISLWIKPATASGLLPNTFCSRWNPFTTQPIFARGFQFGSVFIGATERLTFTMQENAFVTLQVRSFDSGSLQDTINIGEWNHCLVTYDGSASASGVEFYINGIKTGRTVTANTLTTANINYTQIGFPMNFGVNALQLNNAGTSFLSGYDGNMLDLRVFNRALTEGEASDLYLTNVPRHAETLNAGIKNGAGFNATLIGQNEFLLSIFPLLAQDKASGCTELGVLGKQTAFMIGQNIEQSDFVRQSSPGVSG